MNSDLRARLSRLGYRLGDGQPSEGEEPLDQPSPRPSPTGGGGYTIDQVVEGSYLETPHGGCFVAEHAHPAGHPHGAYRLDEALEVEPEQLFWLGRDPKLAEFDLSQFAFLDTETTGLAGGTGTYAFLVGLGYFHGSRFVVRQFFMEDFDAEEAALHALSEALQPLRGLVTFNGKAFDLPLLETRFQMASIPFPLRGAPHLDLLFPSRRLWKDRLESCALSSLEAEILGVEREGDVPGWLIPSLYFGYLRDGDARPLASVFEHNRQDLLSLATLATRLARQHADPFHPEVEDPRDLAALGAVFEGLGLADRAALCYERAVALSPAGELRSRAMVRLGTLYKRLRLRQDAVAIWERLVGSGHAYTLVAYLEMAKHYEHVARDYLQAERITLQALSALDLRAARSEPWRAEQERRELEHRLARLRRKLGRDRS
ncbi:MAG: ribonuclease H-like domain-containing protein [Chloroflexota bacterium]